MAYYAPDNVNKLYAADMATQPRPPAAAMAPLQPASFNDKGVFAVPKGMFMPDGSIQQAKAVDKAKRLGQPSIADEPDQTPQPMQMGGMPAPTQSRRKPLPTLNLFDTSLTTQLARGMPSTSFSSSRSLLDDEI